VRYSHSSTGLTVSNDRAAMIPSHNSCYGCCDCNLCEKVCSYIANDILCPNDAIKHIPNLGKYSKLIIFEMMDVNIRNSLLVDDSIAT
jgi:hypothetical protein